MIKFGRLEYNPKTGIILSVSRRLLEALETDDTRELVGHNIFEFILPEYHEQVKKRIADKNTTSILYVMKVKNQLYSCKIMPEERNLDTPFKRGVIAEIKKVTN